MSTTTIRLDDNLKSRLVTAAEHAGLSAHAFILDAIARTVEQAELDAQFHRTADERLARIQHGAGVLDFDNFAAYATQRAAGKPAAKPKTRKSALALPRA